MLNGVTFACVLAARAGSKRLKSKNLRRCAGKPLWEWTKEAVDAAQFFDNKIITTDLRELYQYFVLVGWIWSTRPPELTGDDVHISDVMQWVAQRDYIDHEYLCLVSPTNPLRTGTHIRDAAKLMLKEKADAVVAIAPCHPVRQNARTIVDATLRCYNSFRCDQPTDIEMQNCRLTGSIIIAKTELWLRKASIYNDPNIKTVGYVMPKWDIDVDGRDDLFMAEAMLWHQRRKRISSKSSLRSALRARSRKSKK